MLNDMNNRTCITWQVVDIQLVICNYFPMQNVKSIDNQLVKCTVVQMWFKSFGNNFHVFGTKTDSKSLR